ncbi:MAG: AAA family ATPase [Sedimentisphaerales bacterium]|jgi:chromosome partitioning protein|nr:AAA family ATPase [Sedimentisphaerales bacterium]
MAEGMRVIAVANQKGGCGKTTTAVNLAAALALMGRRVLLMDLDPQGNATLGLGYRPGRLTATMYHAMVKGYDLEAILLPTCIPRLRLAPSNVLLAGAELDLKGVLGKELVLGEVLRQTEQMFDLCIIDCCPSLGILALNALVASTDVIVPVQAHFYALEGLHRLLETVHVLRRRFQPCAVRPLGLVLTFVDERTSLSIEVREGIRRAFGQLVFQTVIHSAIALAEAPRHGQTILTSAPHTRAAREHLELAKEVLIRLARTAAQDQPSARPAV